jgi:hypothetical protein
VADRVCADHAGSSFEPVRLSADGVDVALGEGELEAPEILV